MVDAAEILCKLLKFRLLDLFGKVDEVRGLRFSASVERLELNVCLHSQGSDGEPQNSMDLYDVVHGSHGRSWRQQG